MAVTPWPFASRSQSPDKAATPWPFPKPSRSADYPKKRSQFAPTRQKPMVEGRRFKIAAIDTETYSLDGKLLIAQSFHEDEKEAKTFPTARLLLDYVFSLPPKLNRKTIWYAHNAEYDWRYFMDALPAFEGRYKFECLERAKGKFYQINVFDLDDGERVTTFRDSMALYNRSLKDFTQQFAPAYVKQDIGLGRGVIFDPANPTHIEYAKNDVIGLVEALKTYDRELWEKFGVHIKGTFSSTAYSAWLRFAPADEYFNRMASRPEQFIRDWCYYGGVVQINAVYGHEYESVTTFDINSSYPAAMRLGVPKGRPVWTHCYKPGFPGFYETIAHVPEDAIMPIVPHKTAEGKISWPTGTFRSCLSSMEIEYCQTKGVKFEIQKGYYFPEGLIDAFGEFIDLCEPLRAQYKGQPTETVVKFMQNSVYGRFGMKPEGRECVIDFRGIPEGMSPIIDEESGEMIPNAYFKDVVRDAPYMLPQFAAWITAGARIRIDQMTEAAGRSSTLYRDTDSISVVGDITPELADHVGPRYGQLKNEGVKHATKYHAPKIYSYIDAKGAKRAVCKGIPHAFLEPSHPQSDHLWNEIHADRQPSVEYHSSTSLQTHMKTGKKFIIRKRRVTSSENIHGHCIDKVSRRFRPIFRIETSADWRRFDEESHRSKIWSGDRILLNAEMEARRAAFNRLFRSAFGGDHSGTEGAPRALSGDNGGGRLRGLELQQVGTVVPRRTILGGPPS